MSQINVRPEIAEIPLAEIRPAPYNPRQITPAALAGLQESLAKFGLLAPLVVNKRTGNLIAGHQKLKILQTAGVATAPAVMVDFDEPTEKAANLALNSPAIAGTFTADLGPLIDQLRKELPQAVLDLRLQELRAQIAGMEQDLNIPPAIARPRTATTRPGQLLHLGRHRILCGDPATPADVDRLLAGRDVPLLADLLPFVRPPLELHHALGHVQQTASVVLGCHDSGELTAAEFSQVKAWKLAPELYPQITNRLAAELAEMLTWTFAAGTWPRDVHAVMATPPPGSSHAKGRPHAAGFLARAVASALDLDLVVIFAPIVGKHRHGVQESLNAPPLQLLRDPGRLVLIVDDISTSGQTVRRCRAALATHGSLAAVWLFYHGGFRPVPEGTGIVFDPFCGNTDSLFECEIAGRQLVGMTDAKSCDVLAARWASWQAIAPAAHAAGTAAQAPEPPETRPRDRQSSRRRQPPEGK